MDLKNIPTADSQVINPLGLPKANLICPESSGYDLRKIASFPSRIFNPPRSSSNLNSKQTGSEPKKETTFGMVRRFSTTPMGEVKLEDILAGKHLPPLTLSEFEDHLINVQYSVENLYFCFWLKDYTKRYRRWEASIASPSQEEALLTGQTRPSGLAGMEEGEKKLGFHDLEGKGVQEGEGTRSAPGLAISPSSTAIPPDLELSFQLALKVFLPNSEFRDNFDECKLELNISDAIRQKFMQAAQTSKDPSIFEPLQREVTGMLKRCMKRWIGGCSGNADRNRTWFALGLGILCGTLALITSLLIINQNPHTTRTIGSTPIFWLGAVVFVCGLYCTCPVIFLFGNYRQIHVWELLREKHECNDEEKALRPGEMLRPEDFYGEPTSISDSPAKSSCDLEATAFQTVEQQENHIKSLHKRLRTLKNRTSQVSPGVFGPITAVLSPIVVRAQRLNIIKAAAWATLASFFWILLWGLISLS